jgi:dihydrofolate synthase / folylpolyglutamate synthase
MNYSSVLQKLYTINKFSGMKLGLENMRMLLSALHNPENNIAAIHVAGTNGKGSTSTKIAETLTYAGFRVGLYTSPHISCFRERIKINGEMITEEAVAAYLDSLFQIAKEKAINATFFEYVTALAFAYFRDQKVDFAVFEAGLGGRLDATNVCEPILSVITSISLDHTYILGSSIEEITREKAGIIKHKVPVVIGPKVPVEIVQLIAGSQDAPVIRVGESQVSFDEENRLIARTALESLSKTIPINQEAIIKGLEALPSCRFERVSKQLLQNRFGEKKLPKEIILDVAHNPDGLERLFLRMRQEYGDVAVHVVYGASKDKNIEECLKIILKEAKRVTFIQAESERAASVRDLLKAAELIAPNKEFAIKEVTSDTSIAQACESAAKEGALLVLCGTFFIMSGARAFLGYNEPQDDLILQERLV